MARTTTPASERLIASRYAVDVSRPLDGAGGGLPAYVAMDRRGEGRALMAVQARPSAPLRAGALATLQQGEIPGLLMPLACGGAAGPDGREAGFVICPAPAGRSLAAAPRPWHSSELLEEVLRPAAACLEMLRTKGVTHRAIRPDNVFEGQGFSGSGGGVTLGCAWAAPPASLQPALFEPPYVAMCLPGGRGEGCIADDVYALGVTLLVLALGAMPLEGVDPAGVIRRKLELGSYAALVGQADLPARLGELLRAMLAEDPAHRPTPLLLLDGAARTRIVPRGGRRAAQPLPVTDIPAWEARTLAYAIAVHPNEGCRLLRDGTVEGWVRRRLGDAGLATRLQEAVSGAPAEDGLADGMLAMRGVALLDPLAPLCWQGLALWPDGLGPALAEAEGCPADVSSRLQSLVATEAAAAWAGTRAETCDTVAIRHEARQNRLWLRGGGMLRVLYGLNPLLGCGGALLDDRFVTRPEDLLPALDAAASQAQWCDGCAFDGHVTAFLAAHHEPDGPEGAGVLAPLRMLARLQIRTDGPPVPALAARLAQQVAPALSGWHSRSRRAALQQRLGLLAAAGQLAPMLALLEDAAGRETDEQGWQAAKASLDAIDLALERLEGGFAQRHQAAERIGHRIAAVVGVAAVASMLAAAALG